MIEGEIPALHAALQTAQYHRENDARIHNGTIGDLLLALNVKQTACRMKEKHIAEQKPKITALNQEIVSLRKELSKEKEENRKWNTIEQEMQEIHFDEYVFDILYGHLCLNFQKCTLSMNNFLLHAMTAMTATTAAIFPAVMTATQHYQKFSKIIRMQNQVSFKKLN